LCFAHCKSLKSVSFALDAKLSRLENGAFSGSGINLAELPAPIRSKIQQG
jgi:hypothetical protein